MPPAPLSSPLLCHLQRPWIAAAAALFMLLNLLTVPLGPWLASHRAPTPNFYPRFFPRNWRPPQWPIAGQYFIVNNPTSPRFVDADSGGSFDDWELPLASRATVILSVVQKDRATPLGWWSPVALRCESTTTISLLSTGDPLKEDTAKALAFYCDNIEDRDGKSQFTRDLRDNGRTAITRVLWKGVLNDAIVLIALGFLVVSLAGLPAWKRRRDAAKLARGVCPRCGYALTGLSTGSACPECGAKEIA